MTREEFLSSISAHNEAHMNSVAQKARKDFDLFIETKHKSLMEEDGIIKTEDLSYRFYFPENPLPEYIDALVDYIKSLGFKVDIYNSSVEVTL